MRLFELKQKEIINIRDGKRFGFMSDLDIDEKIGCAKKIIIPGNNKILGVFGKETEYFIPWINIKQIGDDIILVDIETNRILKESS